jgi:hypothetical protein
VRRGEDGRHHADGDEQVPDGERPAAGQQRHDVLRPGAQVHRHAHQAGEDEGHDEARDARREGAPTPQLRREVGGAQGEDRGVADEGGDVEQQEDRPAGLEAHGRLPGAEAPLHEAQQDERARRRDEGEPVPPAHSAHGDRGGGGAQDERAERRRHADEGGEGRPAQRDVEPHPADHRDEQQQVHAGEGAPPEVAAGDLRERRTAADGRLHAEQPLPVEEDGERHRAEEERPHARGTAVACGEADAEHERRRGGADPDVGTRAAVPGGVGCGGAGHGGPGSRRTDGGRR